jgi:acyl-CoA-binding protein
MSLFADGVITIYNYFTNSANSFVVLTSAAPHKFVTVQPEAGDTIESLAQKIRDRIKEDNAGGGGGKWIKHWMAPINPSELEKAFDEAVEWSVAYAEFDKACASMLSSTLSKRHGKDVGHKLFACMSQAIHGDAKSKNKPWFRVNGTLWQSHNNLAGMTREKAMEQAVEEVARLKILFSYETIVPGSKS